MRRASWKRLTVSGLLVLVAASALVMALLRPPAPPNEVEAIALAKAWFSAHNEFDHPKGYWVRTAWDDKLGAWRVGFTGAGGSSLLARVSPDRSCRSLP